jgi:hypothetical protein
MLPPPYGKQIKGHPLGVDFFVVQRFLFGPGDKEKRNGGLSERRREGKEGRLCPRT